MHTSNAAQSPEATTEAACRRERDASLAAALVRGDPGAARQAWTQLSPFVLRTLSVYFGSGPDCQDLCQEVFLRFFSRIGELREPRALRNFLHGISLGVAQNERRRIRVRSWIAPAPTGDLPDHPVACVDLEAREAIVRFHRLLAGIDVEDRALFLIRFVDKMELTDIAAASGWSLSTTRRRLTRVTRRVGLRMKSDPALAGYVERLLPARG